MCFHVCVYNCCKRDQFCDALTNYSLLTSQGVCLLGTVIFSCIHGCSNEFRLSSVKLLFFYCPLYYLVHVQLY